MKKLSLIMACFLLPGFVFAQTKSKAPATKPLPEMKKILTGIGLPVTIVNDTLAFVPYEGENISSYQVLVQKISDLYIVYTNLTEIFPGKIDEGKYQYLLQQNDHYDLIKIGISADGTVYLRADVYKSGTNTALLKRIIKQVANVTNIIGGELKQAN
jgi:hypothetical protein